MTTTAPSLREMLDAGVHFGHKTSRWSPKMAPFIFTSKSGVHIINLELTEEKLMEAANFLRREVESGKIFVFVGTKKQSSQIVKEAAISCGMPYVNTRWLGGTLTNNDMIKSAIKKLKKQKLEIEKTDSELSKSELSKLRREIERGEKYLGGLSELERKPDGLILFGAHDEKNAIKEAQKVKLPIVALVDTNADPNSVDYPIPANDDATKSVKLIAEYLAKVIAEAKPKKIEEVKK